MAATILIIEADATVLRRLREILEPAGYAVRSAPDSTEGLRLLGSHPPAMILLDVAIAPGDGYQVVARLRQEEGRSAHVPVIMLTAERDVEQKIRALRAGADDYLVKPTDPSFHPAELLARTRSLLARYGPTDAAETTPLPLGQVHAYLGAKGGAGTTTLAINAAVALQHEGHSVCLVDAKLQYGDHRVFLDLGQDLRGIVDVVTAPALDAEMVRTVLAKHESGVELLLAPTSPGEAGVVRPEHMSSILGILRGLFDYVVVDVDNRLDTASLGVVETSDVAFLVLTADLSSLKNVRLILETLANSGSDHGQMKLVLNRSTAFTGINTKAAEGALGRPIDHRIVNDYRTAIGALNSGAPFQLSRADSALGRSVAEFARAVAGVRLEPAAPAQERGAQRAAFFRR